MELGRKHIHFLGDSITYGISASSTSKSYVGLFRAQYPDAVIENYGVCGSCISDKCIWNVEDMRTRARRMTLGADLIIISGGTNDFFCLAPLGQKFERRADTFRGAYYLLLDDVEVRFAAADIVLCTPPPRFDESCMERDGRVRFAPLCDYSEVVKEMGEYYHLPVIDLFSLDVFRSNNFDMTVDGLHPTDAGHEILFLYLRNALLNL